MGCSLWGCCWGVVGVLLGSGGWRVGWWAGRAVGGSGGGHGGTLKGLGPEGVGARRVGVPKGGRPEISLFFPSPATIFILSSFLGGLLVEFWWCF